MRDTEQTFTLKEACREFTWHPAVKTIRTWIVDGLLNQATGQRVFLESNKEGGYRVVTLEQIETFKAALNRK